MEFLTESMKQTPHLAVLVGLVVLFMKGKRDSDIHFLKTLTNMDNAWRESMKSRDEALTHLGDNCHAFQRDLATRNEAIFGKVVDAMNHNTDMLGRSIHVIERLESRHDTKPVKRKVSKGK